MAYRDEQTILEEAQNAIGLVRTMPNNQRFGLDSQLKASVDSKLVIINDSQISTEDNKFTLVMECTILLNSTSCKELGLSISMDYESYPFTEPKLMAYYEQERFYNPSLPALSATGQISFSMIKPWSEECTFKDLFTGLQEYFFNQSPYVEYFALLFHDYPYRIPFLTSNCILGKKITSGACGSIFEGLFNNCEVAIKVPLNQTTEKRHSFFGEIAIMHSLREQEYVVKSHGCYYDGTSYYLVMEKGGPSLREILADVNMYKKENLPLRIKIGYQIAAGIRNMHKCGYFHCDIKPENILCFGDTYKICDFGFAKRIGVKYYTFEGTLDYAAPELLRRREYSSKVDIYSLGIVLLELFTGYTPTIDRTGRAKNAIKKVQNDIKEALQQREPEYPAGLKSLILACCSVRPEDRYDAEEVVSSMEYYYEEYCLNARS